MVAMQRDGIEDLNIAVRIDPAMPAIALDKAMASQRKSSRLLQRIHLDPEAKTPLKDLLFREKTIDVNALYQRDRQYAERNQQFFHHFLPETEKIEHMTTLESKRFALDMAVRNYKGTLDQIQLNWLFNYYRDLSGWKQMKSIYQAARDAKMTVFTQDPFIVSDYVLALNRSGASGVIDFLQQYTKERKARGEEPIEEEFINYGTAYKNRAFQKGVSSNIREKALQKAYENYMRAYQMEDSYYAGSNAVRCLIYLRQTKAAQQLGKMVYRSAVIAHNGKSFWPVATLLELAILSQQQRQVARLMPIILNLGNGGAEIENLLQHLRYWQEIDKGNNGVLNACIGILEAYINGRSDNGSKFHLNIGASQEQFVKFLRGRQRKVAMEDKIIDALEKFTTEKDPTEVVQEVVIRLGVFRRGGVVLPQNLKYGGIVSDNISSRADFKVAEAMVKHPIGEGDFDPMGDGKSLGEMETIDEANQWIANWIAWRFHLTDENGQRVLENLHSKHHEDFDEFSSHSKEIAGMDVFEKAAFEFTGASDPFAVALMGRGDCRVTHFVATLLRVAWNRYRRETDRKRALEAFEESRKNHNFSAFDEAVSRLSHDRFHDFGIMQILIHADIQGTGVKGTDGNSMYDILINDHGDPELGNAIGIVRTSPNHETVIRTIYDRRLQLQYDQRGTIIGIKGIPDNELVKDQEGNILGYPDPELQIGDDGYGNEILYRMVDSKKEIDHTLKILRTADGVAHVLRRTEDHTTGVEIKYDKEGEAVALKFEDVWYDGTQFLIYNGKEINVQDILKLTKQLNNKQPGELIIHDGIKARNPRTGKIENHPIILEISPFSSAERLRHSHRYSPGYLHLFGQPILDPYNEQTMKGIINLLFNQEAVQGIQDRVVTPITHWQSGNAAMASQQNTTKGGIDFNPNKLNLQVTGSPSKIGSIQFHLDAGQLAQLKEAPGFMPLIIGIQPVANLPKFFGLDTVSSPLMKT